MTGLHMGLFCKEYYSWLCLTSKKQPNRYSSLTNIRVKYITLVYICDIFRNQLILGPNRLTSRMLIPKFILCFCHIICPLICQNAKPKTTIYSVFSYSMPRFSYVISFQHLRHLVVGFWDGKIGHWFEFLVSKSDLLYKQHWQHLLKYIF